MLSKSSDSIKRDLITFDQFVPFGVSETSAKDSMNVRDQPWPLRAFFALLTLHLVAIRVFILVSAERPQRTAQISAASEVLCALLLF